MSAFWRHPPAASVPTPSFLLRWPGSLLPPVGPEARVARRGKDGVIKNVSAYCIMWGEGGEREGRERGREGESEGGG